MAVIQDITGVNTLAINASGQAPVIDAKFPNAAVAADAYANPTITHEGADLMLFNGTTWDRARNNFAMIADSSAARTSTLAGATVTNFWLNGRRNIPEPIARILDLMARRPELINEF